MFSESWGKKYAELVASGSLLVTIMYPWSSVPLPQDTNIMDGPPYDVTLEAYRAVLDASFEIVYGPHLITNGTPRRADREYLAVWRRK